MTSHTEPERTLLPAGVARIRIPITDGSEPETSGYLLRHANDSVTIVDPGESSPLARGAVDRALESAGSPAVAAIFVTHAHRDHAAGAPALARRYDAPVIIHPAESAEIMASRDGGWRTQRSRQLREWGVPTDRAKAMLGSPHLLPDWQDVKLLLVIDGEFLPFSNERFQVVGMPGHTAGSLALLAAADSLLLSGDLLLPHRHVGVGIGADFGIDPIGDQLASLERLRNIGPAVIAPGHGAPFIKVEERITAERAHLLRRLAEVRSSFDRAPTLSVWQRASTLTWRRPWAQLDSRQQRVALNQLAHFIAHLSKSADISNMPD